MPKRPADLSVSPITRSETNLDVSVEESGPVRADEIGPRPTDAEEDVVQAAEEFKHVPAPILPSKSDVESHNVSHLPFRNSSCEIARVKASGVTLCRQRV